MPLVKAQCPNCNGTLDIDKKKDAAICPYCGSAFIVEKAIQQFITNHNTINNIQTAIIQNGFSEEKYEENGIVQLKLEKYQDASETFTKMSRDYPNNWKAWVGLSIAQNGINHKVILSILEDKSFNLVPQHIKELIGDGSIFWEDICILEFENKKNKVKKEIKSHSDKINSCKATIQHINDNIKKWNSQKKELEIIVGAENKKQLRFNSENSEAMQKLHYVNSSIATAMVNNQKMLEKAKEEKKAIAKLQKSIEQIENEKETELARTDHRTIDYYINVLEENITKVV